MRVAWRLRIGSLAFAGVLLLPRVALSQQPLERKEGAAKKAGNVDITGADGFQDLCPSKTYSYSIQTPTGATNLNGFVWTAAAGVIQGSSNQSTVQIKWNLGQTRGAISARLEYTGSDNKTVQADGTQDVTIQAAPAVGKPAILNATSLNRAYLAPNKPATFTAVSGGTAAEYQWSVPSCFGLAGTVTTASPSLTVSNTGACAAQICVIALNRSCGLMSPPSCESFQRAPRLSSIEGPSSFCKSATVQYCVDPIPGVDCFTWIVPSHWKINGSRSGRCISVSARTGLVANTTGILSVYGTVSAINSNTASQASSIGIEVRSPTALARVRPRIKVESTPNQNKKKVTITFPNLSFHYRWDYTVSGADVNTKRPAGDGESRSVIMTSNQYLRISTYTQNSCGFFPGNNYAFQMKNGALIPVELP